MGASCTLNVRVHRSFVVSFLFVTINSTFVCLFNVVCIFGWNKWNEINWSWRLSRREQMNEKHDPRIHVKLPSYIKQAKTIQTSNHNNHLQKQSIKCHSYKHARLDRFIGSSFPLQISKLCLTDSYMYLYKQLFFENLANHSLIVNLTTCPNYF